MHNHPHINEYPADQYPYRIRNWRKYQHYRFRNPPWIKLHTEILSSEDWVVLDDASKLLAVVIMLIAVKHDGYIPASVSPAYLKRVAYLDKLPNIKPLITCNFLEKTLADASNVEHLRTNADTETETETETEREIDISVDVKQSQKKKGTSEKAVDLDFEAFWKAYPSRKGSNPKQLAKTRFLSAVQKGTTAGQLVAAADAYADEQLSLGKTGTEFVAQASTWLNQQRYLDYHRNNGDSGERIPAGLTPEQKKAWVQEEMRKFREAASAVEHH